ncbi:MAG: FkbM family methyltransferase [Desulfarculales bacterium]|jgi:FkbM family methyltransferase|nr:FkbM family methyltransferase [Desulfarculales bacterium]
MRAELIELLDRQVTPPKSKAVGKLTALPCLRDIVIYGAGHWGGLVWRILRNTHQLPCFADSNPLRQGEIFCGLPIRAPEELADICRTKPLILVAIEEACLDASVYHALLQRIEHCGLKDYEIIFLDYHDLGRYKNYDDKFCRLHKSALIDLYAWLGDNFSRQTLIEWLRLNREKDIYNYPVLSPQYFQADLFELRADEVIVDCGAFDGDTVDSVIEYYKNFTHVYAYEPHPQAYRKLCRRVNIYEEDIRSKISAYQCAVAADNREQYFNIAKFRGARLSSKGTVKVPVKKLDDLLKSVRFTLLKMDIEGSELAALRGAEEVIKNNDPVLCICLYHREADIIDIPAWIRDRFPRYSLYLRKHANRYASELVLYAIPPYRGRF